MTNTSKVTELVAGVLRGDGDGLGSGDEERRDGQLCRRRSRRALATSSRKSPTTDRGVACSARLSIAMKKNKLAMCMKKKNEALHLIVREYDRVKERKSIRGGDKWSLGGDNVVSRRGGVCSFVLGEMVRSHELLATLGTGETETPAHTYIM